MEFEEGEVQLELDKPLSLSSSSNFILLQLFCLAEASEEDDCNCMLKLNVGEVIFIKLSGSLLPMAIILLIILIVF